MEKILCLLRKQRYKVYGSVISPGFLCYTLVLCAGARLYLAVLVAPRADDKGKGKTQYFL